MTRLQALALGLALLGSAFGWKPEQNDAGRQSAPASDHSSTNPQIRLYLRTEPSSRCTRKAEESLCIARAAARPTAAMGALAAESPIRFVNGGRSLLVGDSSSKDVILTVVDLASGQRQAWKRLYFSVQRKGKSVVVTPDLKYYAYYSPRYSSDLYLVENLR
jgi:hypothetical protein